MMRIKPKYLPKVLLCVPLFGLFGVAASLIYSFDVFWQLQSGRYILETGQFLYAGTSSLAAEAPRFVKLITEFTQQMKDLGPLGKAEGLSADELKERLQKGLEVVSAQAVRVSYGNASKAVRKDGIWTDEHIGEIINTKMAKSLEKALG